MTCLSEFDNNSASFTIYRAEFSCWSRRSE